MAPRLLTLPEQAQALDVPVMILTCKFGKQEKRIAMKESGGGPQQYNYFKFSGI
jgi:hypothetical protein